MKLPFGRRKVFSKMVSLFSVDYLIDFLVNLFPFPPEDEEFIRTYYIPEVRKTFLLTKTFLLSDEILTVWHLKIREATQDLSIPILQRIQLQNNFESTLIKLMYAFLWQEWVVTNATIIFDPDFNAAGTFDQMFFKFY